MTMITSEPGTGTYLVTVQLADSRTTSAGVTILTLRPAGQATFGSYALPTDTAES